MAAPILAASVAMTTGMASTAQAFDLVPQQEGEVALDNLNCLTGSCLELDPIVQSVVSEQDDSTGTYSRLFVDKYDTANDYGSFGFSAKDVGTSDTAGDYWFRPVAFDQNGNAIEGGELEVGTFKFVFAEIIESLTVSWFDTERSGTNYSGTVILSDGSTASFEDKVPKGPDSNTYEKTFFNVESITLDLGQKSKNPKKTGDGVNFQVSAEPVPEPSVMLGVAAVTMMGGFARRKQRKANA